MRNIGKMAIALCVLGLVVVTSGYFIDNHRCRQINYEQAGYELPDTWLLNAKQCLDVAHSIRLRRYARNL